MQETVVEQWLQDTQIQTKVSELLDYAVRDEVDSLKFALDRLALPQQEVVRFQLLEKLENLPGYRRFSVSSASKSVSRRTDDIYGSGP